MKKNVLTILFFVLLLQTGTNGLSQNKPVEQQGRYISGRITDAVDGAPVPAATVFVAGTTEGTVTDSEGCYRLRIPGEGSYRLTVSHIGYQPAFIEIEPRRVSVYNVALNIHEIDEVTVNLKVKARQRDITLFWRTLLGKSPSKRTINVVNPEAAYYYYNSKTKILNVTCREPLLIINNETGFHIQLVLGHFTHDYNTELTSWKFELGFTELIPENNKQKTSWDINRINIYRVSMTNFIKSLYNNTLMENGYLLTYPQRTLAYGNMDNTYENPDIFLSADPNSSCKTFYIPPDRKDLILVCFGVPVTQSMLENVKQAQDTYAISFAWMKSRQNPDYTWSNLGLFRNIIETPDRPVSLYPDGTCDYPVKLSPLLSNSLAGLNMMLPSNFIPDVGPDAIFSVYENDFAEYKHASIQNDPSQISDSIFNAIRGQLEVYPQEKIHLHTDRDVYVPGEKIWFKAYLTDAQTHQYPTQSRYVYAELIDAHDSLINRVMVRPENDMFYGNLPIINHIPEGNYTLRAYTRYMENLGDDYFFKKNIRIKNPISPSPILPHRDGERDAAGSYAEQRTNSSLSGELEGDYEVFFFPEGGNLVEGVFNKLAFKTLNQNGYPETISGEITDESGLVIERIQTLHAGMGVFSYMSESGKKIFLKCRNGNGLEKQFEIPQSAPHVYALTVSQYNKCISVGIRESAYTPEIPLYILAHCRGTVLYFAPWNRKNEYISFSEEELPSGIIQFLLFDEQINPLSERLVFNKNYEEDVKHIEIQTDKTSYKKREKITVTFNAALSLFGGGVGGGLEDNNKAPALYDSFESLITRRSEDTTSNRDLEIERHSETLPHTGINLSVAITDDNDFAVDFSTTILSSLLLSSELKGYIENPAWYLQDNIISSTALDYLMMTHGWRRYNVPEIVNGNPEYLQIPFQTGQEISGKVKSMTFSRSVDDCEISILMKDGDYGITSTDENGTFRFDDCEYPDSTSFFIQALSKQGSNRVELILDSISFPEPIHAIQSPFEDIPAIREEAISDSNSNTLIMKAEERLKYDEGMRVIYMDEVEVTAQKIDKKEEQRLRYWMNASSTYTIRKEQIERIKPRLVSDMLRTIPGLGSMNNAATAIASGSSPLIFIDGIEYTSSNRDLFSPLESVNVSDVESIDVVKSYHSSIFGGRANGAGVISITTKKGIENISQESQNFNYTVYTPLGYQKPIEFYSPNYETLESKYQTIPDYRTTIFWKPDVVIADNGKASVEFYTSDFPTTYSIVIEGLTLDGKIIRQEERVRVE